MADRLYLSGVWKPWPFLLVFLFFLRPVTVLTSQNGFIYKLCLKRRAGKSLKKESVLIFLLNLLVISAERFNTKFSPQNLMILITTVIVS